MQNKVINKLLAENILETELMQYIQSNQSRVIVIGIDGPTACGKTILANNLSEKLNEKKFKVWNYRLDWTLKERSERIKDLENIKQKKISFDQEAELHMQLKKAKQFLQMVREYNQSIAISAQSSPQKINLENLYSRENNGTCTHKETCDLEPGLIIFIEGHYSLRYELDLLIDKNILILADSSELIKRKIDRVKGYRNSEEAEDYYWRIDLPSIQNHLKRFAANADLIIDNTDINNPLFKKHEFINQWCEINKSKNFHQIEKIIDSRNLVDSFFCYSIFISEENKKVINQAILGMQECDRLIGNHFKLSVNDIEHDLNYLINHKISEINKSLPKEYSIEFKYSNAFYNAYFRKLPISFGIKITCPELEMSIISEVNYNSQTFQIFWEGGYKKFEFMRELGSLEDKKQLNAYHFIKDQKKASENIIYTPTDFTIPEFIINTTKFTKVYTGLEENNITASEIILKMSSTKECLWIHRFSKHSTARYFEKILSQIGCDTLKVGSYLICLKSSDQTLISKYKKYKIDWVSDTSEKKLNQVDEDAYDKNIDDDQKFVYEFVKMNCPNFKILDNFLYCSISYLDEKWELIIDQIFKMMNSNNRLLRKKVFVFIKKNFPNLKVLNKKLWPHLNIEESKHISIDELSSTYPSILAEIFMWITLRNENSSILGSNIYDIREQSIDARAHLEQASKLNTPVIIQSSLNAIGQKEGGNWGYLKVEDSTNSLSKAIINESRNMINLGYKPPLFGIGLDHINVNGDKPSGRAIRFAKKAMESELVTYYVLDAESLFKPKNREPKEVKRLFKVMSEYVMSLLHDNQRAYIYDKEVCISELNYLGGHKAWIPSPEEVVSFAKEYRKVVRDKNQAACNTRPVLFIGNVGTTHHSNDSGEINSEISSQWVESSKRYNFISAVLHGTTNTNLEIIKSANVGCKK
jgi:uridine kinase